MQSAFGSENEEELKLHQKPNILLDKRAMYIIV